MPTRLKKTRHQRGSTFHGYGRVGKHRKHPSGRGNAGGMHHHRTNMSKYHPGYFCKVGQRHYHKTKNMYWKPTVNLNNLAKFIGNKQMDKAQKGKALPVVDLLRHGYSKLLGAGVIQVPCIVKARWVSKRADHKIRKAGGAVVLQA